MHWLLGATCSKYHQPPHWFPGNELHRAFLQGIDSQVQRTPNTLNQGIWLIHMHYIEHLLNVLITRCNMLKIPSNSILVPRKWIASSISSKHWLACAAYSKYPQSGYLNNPHALHWTLRQCINNKVTHAQNTLYFHTGSCAMNCIEHFFNALTHRCNIIQIPSIRALD